jgi:undecaprenyl-diphosphatase
MGIFKFTWDENNKFVAKLLLSAIPVAIAGLLFEDKIEAMFSGSLIFIGIMLLVTAILLTIANYARKGNRKIGFWDSFIIGIAQMIAIIPGISRSGATIATGMILGNDKTNLAKFSFLMVIIPIMGANLLKIVSGDLTAGETSIGTLPMIAGFLTAFTIGLLACRWMINIVRKGKLIYFAIYCTVIGLIAIFAA